MPNTADLALILGVNFGHPQIGINKINKSGDFVVSMTPSMAPCEAFQVVRQGNPGYGIMFIDQQHMTPGLCHELCFTPCSELEGASVKENYLS